MKIMKEKEESGFGIRIDRVSGCAQDAEIEKKKRKKKKIRNNDGDSVG